jgi:hypothetical protein
LIVSASYKTDIPTFYGEWFIRRLRAGFCRVVQPYNRRIATVDLRREHVDGIVFWTKNVGPFLPHLYEVRDRGYPFMIQYTINAYPRALETSVVDAKRAVDDAGRVRTDFGPHVIVWRYDTIIISDLTPLSFHRENFVELARMMEGVTDEVVISFAHYYQKTRRNMTLASRKIGFSWSDPEPEEKRALCAELVKAAAQHGLELTVCSQPDYLAPGAAPARCIDASRLERISGSGIRAQVRGNRPGCACFAARDIGEYDTCPHGCVYCYAVRNREFAGERYKLHDPNSEFLFPPPANAQDVDDATSELPFE